MNSTLFVGGSYDGIWIDVPKGQHSVQLPRRKRIENALDLIFGPGASGTETYERRVLMASAIVSQIKSTDPFYFFAPVRMPTSEALAWLLAGYLRAPILS